MATKRLFIGLGFNNDFVGAISPWVRKIKKTADRKEISLKWAIPENYHITLVFLGNIAEEEIPTIHEKMKIAGQLYTAFSLKIRGIGGFPSLQSARVIYVGVQRSQAILDLQSELERQFKAPGEAEYDYTPHMTLARLKNPRSCRDLLSPFEHIDLGKQRVTEIILFSSVLAGSYPIYERVLQVPLKSLD